MVAAVGVPRVLFSQLTVKRKNASISPNFRLETFLSYAKLVSDDVEGRYLNRKSIKCWDKFYERHQNKFFKDRHYLEKDWGKYFTGSDDDVTSANQKKVLLEIGCGAGNTIFPLLAAYPEIFIHACDFSTNALTLAKSHRNYNASQINLFICDVANEELCDKILPSSVDIVTLIFMLSAVSPYKMDFVLQNLKRVLKPSGLVLVRDYAVGDSAQVKLESKNQKMGDNLYYRGDGTLCYYFSEDFLSSLFRKASFQCVDIDTYCRQVENRFRNMTFQRRWIRAIFRKDDCYRSNI